MQQFNADLIVLRVWTNAPTINDGYAAVAYYHHCTIGQARKQWVYPALKRDKRNPHSSPQVIASWLYWRAWFERNGDAIV
jgi:hypothetical protein